MYVSLMYRLWNILLFNMSRPETFGMTLVYGRFCLSLDRLVNDGSVIYLVIN